MHRERLENGDKFDRRNQDDRTGYGTRAPHEDHHTAGRGRGSHVYRQGDNSRAQGFQGPQGAQSKREDDGREETWGRRFREDDPATGAYHAERRDDWQDQRGDTASVKGSFRGKGPINYTRSDERIHDEVAQHLTDHDEIDASGFSVNVKDGEVTLSGTVDSRATKRLAEQVAERVRGVVDVHNQLRIHRAASAVKDVEVNDNLDGAHVAEAVEAGGETRGQGGATSRRGDPARDRSFHRNKHGGRSTHRDKH